MNQLIMTLDIVRKLLIGFMIGGGIGAKIGAYVSQLSEIDYLWNVVEFGILLGSVTGICIAGAVGLYKTGAFKSNDQTVFQTDSRAFAS